MTTLGLHLAQMVLTACLAAWMVSGVVNNLLMPRLNEAAVSLVMRFELMEQEYPDDFAQLKHRKIENTRVIRLMFRLMVLSEMLAALLLVLGALLLGGSLIGAVPHDIACFVAIAGTLAFTLNWTGFLIGGEYFCYWYCHFGSQATHFLLAIWGTIVTGILLIPG